MPSQMVAPWSSVVPATDTGLPGVQLVMGTTTPWFELPTASPTEQTLSRQSLKMLGGKSITATSNRLEARTDDSGRVGRVERA
jgi:hypothetical protein